MTVSMRQEGSIVPVTERDNRIVFLNPPIFMWRLPAAVLSSFRRETVIDSNGSLIISGGTLDLTCNGNGNTAIDCDGDYSFEGSDITTNDGSQNDPGQMGGGMKGQEGRMQFDK